MKKMVLWSKHETAELVGTFFLTFGVGLSLLADLGLPTALVAALVLGLFVYTLGPVSGGHFNPAVTIGLLGIRKVSTHQAVRYIVAQVIGAALAMGAIGYVNGGQALALPLQNDLMIAVAEALGAFVLVFGVTSVVHGKTPAEASGLVIGTSLLLGIFLSSIISNGVLNPAVALGIGSLNIMYVLGPVLGGLLGAQCYDWICKK